ncbi:MAG: RibD family protein [Hyphomicrobiaceae bacterium]
MIKAAPTDRPFVVAQLGQSLDGRIATRSGDSRWINGAAALAHVHRIRASVDAVVVGVGTAISDDPELTVRHTAGRDPARVVIDPNGRLSADAKCLRDDGTRRILIRNGNSTAHCNAEVLSLPKSNEAQLCPREITRQLYAIGLKKILIEGGAMTVSAFVDAGAVDRLHVLVAPIILGSGKTGLDLSPINKLTDAIRPDTSVHMLDGGEVLFDCNLRREVR